MLKKRLKIILLPLATILSILIIYNILLTRACIPLSFQLGINRTVCNVYFALKLKNIFGSNYPILKLVANYPSRLYYLANNNIRDFRGWPVIDYDHNIVFISIDLASLDNFKDQSKINIISKGQCDQYKLGLNDTKNAIKDMILLRLGDMWQAETSYECLYIKLYHNGIISFDYVWHDRNKSTKLQEWEMHKISVQLPVNKEQMRIILKRFNFDKFEKLHTIDTYNASYGWRAPLMAMVVKKGTKIKVIYRNPFLIVKDEIKHGLREFWTEVIEKAKIRENVINIINSEYPCLLEEWQQRDIERWLDVFNGNIVSDRR